MFQSTFPQGERQRRTMKQYFHRAGFNPRSRKGNDKCMPQTPRRMGLFQSTFPQGERLAEITDIYMEIGFNPRSRKGNDLPEQF